MAWTTPARAPEANSKSNVWRGGSPVDPTSESSSLGREEDFFSASRIRTCSRTLLALATGSGDGPSEGTTYAVQEVLGCRADRKQLSATATLILRRERNEFTRAKTEKWGKQRRARLVQWPPALFECQLRNGDQSAARRSVGGTCRVGGDQNPPSDRQLGGQLNHLGSFKNIDNEQ